MTLRGDSLRLYHFTPFESSSTEPSLDLNYCIFKLHCTFELKDFGFVLFLVVFYLILDQFHLFNVFLVTHNGFKKPLVFSQLFGSKPSLYRDHCRLELSSIPLRHSELRKDWIYFFISLMLLEFPLNQLYFVDFTFAFFDFPQQFLPLT